MSKGFIKDTRVKLRPSMSLMRLINEHSESLTDLPENVARALKRAGFTVPMNVDILNIERQDHLQVPTIDIALLNSVIEKYEGKEKQQDEDDDKSSSDQPMDLNQEDQDEADVIHENQTDTNHKEIETNDTLHRQPTDVKDKENEKHDTINENPPDVKHKENEKKDTSSENPTDGKNNEKKEDNYPYLYLKDLIWLNSFLTKLREENKTEVFLHNIITSCSLELPENEIIPRNPILEARCQKLRVEQQNQAYRKMTKNVDSVLKNYPEDTIAYQMKAMNSQIIAVLQFVFSVIAGFVFGFLGVELIIGNLDFGFRLLLGIMCALIIALAEIYFLAKKLNEYDNVAEAAKLHTPKRNVKLHKD